MSRDKKRKFVLLLALTLLPLVFGLAAKVLPRYETTTIYFYDAAHAQFAGESVLLCNGRFLEFGVETQYYDVYQEPCL